MTTDDTTTATHLDVYGAFDCDLGTLCLDCAHRDEWKGEDLRPVLLADLTSDLDDLRAFEGTDDVSLVACCDCGAGFDVNRDGHVGWHHA